MIKNKTRLILLLAGVLIIATIFTEIFLYLQRSDSNKKTPFIKTSPKDQIIYIASDLHYLSNDLTDHKEAFEQYVTSGDGKQLFYIDEIMDAFSYDIKRTKPDILIISGDLTSNGEMKSHLDLAGKLKIIESNGTKVYVIPGNHDIANPWARGFKEEDIYVTETITSKDFSNIYAPFGYEEAISMDDNSLSYLAAASDDIWLLMIDTNKYKNNLDLGYSEAGGILAKGTLDWISECSLMAKKKGVQIITVMHHNVLDHSEVIRDNYTLDNAPQVYINLKEDGLNLVFSGHIHVQDIRSNEKENDRFYDIASGALSVNPHQYGVLRYSALNSSLNYYTEKVDVEGWAKKEKIKDKNLRQFESYAEGYFGKFAYNMAYKALSETASYSENEIKLMSETMQLLNIRFFSGTEALNAEDVIPSEGYQLWSGNTDSFLHNYILSIAKDFDTDDNHLHIDLPSK